MRSTRAELAAAVAFFLLATCVPLGPDGVLDAFGARDAASRVRSAAVHRGPVVHEKPRLAGRGRVRAVAYLGQQACAAATFGVVALLAVAWLGRSRLRVGPAAPAVRTGALLAVGLVSGGGAAALVAARVAGGAPVRGFLDGIEAPLLLDRTGCLLLALTSVALAPLAEELAFRGVILGALDRVLAKPRASIVQAFLFAAVHVRTGLSPATIAFPFVWGLVAARLVRRSDGALGSAVLLHAAGNAVGLVLIGVVMDHGPAIAAALR